MSSEASATPAKSNYSATIKIEPEVGGRANHLNGNTVGGDISGKNSSMMKTNPSGAVIPHNLVPQPTIVRDRIVYLNDALSGLHGSKLRMIAQDIYRARRAVYESQRRKMSDHQLQVYLETKVEDFVRIKYKNKYGLLESCAGSLQTFPPHREPDVFLEKRQNPLEEDTNRLTCFDKNGGSLADSIRLLRNINRQVVKSMAYDLE